MSDWICQAQLGSGGFGIVHVWRNNKTGQEFALKKCKFGSDILMTARHKDAWVREVDIMLRLDHPGVVSCVQTPEGLDPGSEDLPTLCMEFCEEGDLRKELNKPESCRGLQESQVLAILNDITSALGYLHNRRIIHRDLKPENVVLKKSETRTVYKLIDLGYAKELGVSSLAQSFVGTLQYVAPELFLGKDYTKSVDYWSLGLLCHEVVTGQRPFLPNMSPGQWIDYVESKNYEDISVEQSVGGEIIFLTQLSTETQVCRPLASRLEQWLRSLLDWSPETRGKDSDETVTVFTQLNATLRERRASIFSLSQGELLHLTLAPGTTGKSLLYHLSQLTGTLSDNLRLLTPSATLVPPDLILDQSHSLSTMGPHFYLYTMSENKTVRDHLKQKLHIPELVTCFLTDARKSVQDYHQKKMFIHGYHFVCEQSQCVTSLSRGLKVLYHYLTSWMKDVVEKSNLLAPRKEKTVARYDLFRESLQHDLVRYKEQASRKDRITSKKMVDHWNKTDLDLQQMIKEVTSRVNLVHDTVRDVNERLKNAKISEVLTEASEDPELQGLVSKSLSLYSSLRRERPSSRQDTTARKIAQVVVKMLKRRDVLRLACYTELVRLSECGVSMTDLGLAVSLLDKDLSQADSAVSKAQQRRQSDVWTLLAAAVKHSPAGQENKSDQLVKLDPTESDKIIQENEALRTRLDRLRLDNPPADWDSILD